MKPTRHIVADLETLDTQPSAVILTAGLIAVEISDGGVTVLSRWYRHLEFFFQQDQPGRTQSASTWEWWGKQSDLAIWQAFEQRPRLSLWLAMHSLAAWLELHPYPIWGNGSDFDNATLQDAFKQCGLRWPYWRNRCLRSTKGLVQQLAPDVKLPEFPEHLTPHVAIDDAEHEAHLLAALLRALAEPAAIRVSICNRIQIPPVIAALSAIDASQYRNTLVALLNKQIAKQTQQAHTHHH